MLMNNRSPDKSEENDFGRRSAVANEIDEICRLLSEQSKAVDDSCSENNSEISLSPPPNEYQFFEEENQRNRLPEEDDILINTSNLNSIPFDKQNQADSFDSELFLRNHHADVANSDFLLPFEPYTDENQRIQRNKECTRPIIHRHLNGNRNAVPMKNTTKKIPIFSGSHNQLDTQARGKLHRLQNRRPREVNLRNYTNLIDNTALKNDEFASISSLQSEDTFVTSVSSNEMQTPAFSAGKLLSGLNELFQGSDFSTREKNALSFNSMDSSGIGLQKDNGWGRKVLRNATKLTNQYQELISIPEQVLNSTKTAGNKFTSFNFLLQFENQRKLKDGERNLKVSRRSSAPNNAGFISNCDKNCFFVQAKWQSRKCKSEIRILHETTSTPVMKFLKDDSCRDTNIDSNSHNLRKSASNGNPSKLKRIPTLGGHKLPVKASVLLLNGPIILKYTENISGKSQEILMFTSDAIENVTRNQKDIQYRDIVKRLLSKSRPYLGKPIHITFDPRKFLESSSKIDSGEGNPVPLHLSPAKHNLLYEEQQLETSVKCQANKEKNPCRTFKTSVDHREKKETNPLRTFETSVDYREKKGKIPRRTFKTSVDYRKKKETNSRRTFKTSVDYKVKNEDPCRTLESSVVCQVKNKMNPSRTYETLVDNKVKNEMDPCRTFERILDCHLNSQTNLYRTLNSSSKTVIDYTLIDDQSKEIGDSRISNTDDSHGLDLQYNSNRLEAPTKKKLKIRLCRRKKSRTALKHVNVRQIVSSGFRNFFHFYSVLGGHLKSGSVITISNSIKWLREAGVATDARSLETANKLFKDIAGAKVVLNIFDFMQFLGMFARRQRMATVDLVRQLTICKVPMVPKIQRRKNSETRQLKSLPHSKHSGQGTSETNSMHRSQSLPNLKTTPPILSN